MSFSTAVKRRIIGGAAAAALTLGAVGVGVAMAGAASASTPDESAKATSLTGVTGANTTAPSDHPMELPKDVKPGTFVEVGPISQATIDAIKSGSTSTLTEAVPAK
ncbi:hypothetical protein [Plantibacter sp. YIM 135249]|uniref:hypothetical protein n=1 Tax=Plantibacter sp. YIM 135249 TaxID=3423918 RepID=UPI003D34DA97